MPSVTPSGTPPSSGRVLPSSMWPAHPDTYWESVKFHDAAVAARREKAREHRSNAHQLVSGGEGEFIDAAAEKYQAQANAEDLLGDIAAANGGAARTAWRLSCNLTQALEDIDARAQQSLSSSPAAMHPEIKAAAIAAATETIAGYTTEASTAYTRSEAEAASRYETLGLHPDGREKDTTTKALDHSQPRRDENSSTDNTDTRKTSPGNNTLSESNGRAQDRRSNIVSGTESTNDAPPTAGSSPGSFAQSQRSEIVGGGAPSPSRGGSPNLSPSVPGTSGGVGGMPSGGGLGSGGLGSSPLSSLTSGVGKVPSTSGVSPAGGGSALPTSGVGPGAVDPASFGRAVSAGSAAAGVTSSPVSPVATTPSLAGPSASVPVTPGVGPSAVSGPSAVAAGLAGSGQHVPASGSAMPATGVPAPGAGGMLLPSPGLGAPAAAGGGAPVPTVSGAAAPVSGPAGSGGGSSAVAGGVPSMTPPAVMVREAVAARHSVVRESAELSAAIRLVQQLSLDCHAVDYSVIGWAAGVFRSDAVDEIVVMSNDGFGYVPSGVHLPRSVRLLAADVLVGKEFRDRWFGWADPGRVLVEYAKTRVPEWRLIAAATSWTLVDAFREAGVEYRALPWERPETKPLLPVLDGAHVHRLALEYDDLFHRVQDVVDAQSREYVAMQLCGAVMQALPVAGVDCPAELRQMWQLVSAGQQPSPAQWEGFAQQTGMQFLTPGTLRPGGTDSVDRLPTDTDAVASVVVGNQRQQYTQRWQLARAMEVISGWRDRPLPLADMVYAAAAGGLDVRTVLDAPLRWAEEARDR